MITFVTALFLLTLLEDTVVYSISRLAITDTKRSPLSVTVERLAATSKLILVTPAGAVFTAGRPAIPFSQPPVLHLLGEVSNELLYRMVVVTVLFVHLTHLYSSPSTVRVSFESSRFSIIRPQATFDPNNRKLILNYYRPEPSIVDPSAPD